MSLFGTGWSPQDVGVTLGSFANDAANEVIVCDEGWFDENSSAELLVHRYTGAATWVFAESFPAFMALRRPDPRASLDAFRLNRFAWLAASGGAETDEEIWSQMYEDADAFAQAASTPETTISGQPMARIAKEWFAKRARFPLFDRLPSRAAIHLVTITSQLHGGVVQLVAKVGAR